MNLRAKTILAVYLVVLLLMALLYALLRSRTVADYEALEARQLTDRLLQVTNTFDQEEQALARALQDWNDLSVRVRAQSPQQWTQELVELMGRSESADFVVVTDARGALLYAKTRDWPDSQRLPETLRDQVIAPLLQDPAGFRPVSGAVMLNAQSTIVAAHPIVLDQDASRGWLIAGRQLWAAVPPLAARGDGITLTLDSAPAPDPALPAAAGQVDIALVDDQTMLASATLPDPWDRPAVRITLESPRPLRAQAVQAIRYVMGALAVTGLAIALAVYISLELNVIRRLYTMRRRLGQVRELDDLSARLEPQGSDEIGKLTDSINTMLATLARSRHHLAASEDRYRRMVETAQEGIWFIGADGRTRFANQRLLAMLGTIDKEICARLASHWVTRPSQTTFKHLLAAGANRVPPTDLQLRRADGSELWTIATASTILDVAVDDSNDATAGVLLMLTDITDRKLQEQRVEAQAALLDQTRDAIIVTDADGRVLSWNEGAHSLYGHFPAAVRDRRLDDLVTTRSGLSTAQIRDIALADGEWTGELDHARANGDSATVLARWTRVSGWLGYDTALLIVCTDLTEKKQLERQIMRAQRLESIGTLAGGIAHDLNNILAPILSSIWLIRRKTPDALPAKSLDTIERSAQRGVEIVKQVLAFARGSDAEKIPQQPRHILKELQAIVENTVGHKITVRFEIPPDLWLIIADATQVHQAVLNLCVNARDAMPDGGSLTVAAANRQFDAATAAKYHDAKPGHYLRISVADTGSGIPAELMGKIFDPFFTTKDVGKGTGLGLSTVATILHSHGGFLDVESTPGQGTTFRLFFPADPDALKAQAAPLREHASVELRPGMGQTILLVDDEPDIRDTTRDLLETHGYTVITAENGADAVAIFGKRQREIALVLTDMNMPVMDGAATIEALCQMDPRVHIIAVSGAAEADSVIDGRRPNVRAFLRRPYDPIELLVLLSRWVEPPARASRKAATDTQSGGQS